MTSPPTRSPAETAAASAALSAVGICCGHIYGAHAPDGCRACLAERRPADAACRGWAPSALGDIRRLNLGPVGQSNVHLYGIEDSGALTCSTVLDRHGDTELVCGHRADRHYEKPDEPTGLGPCRVDGCTCGQWSYVLPDDDAPPLGEVEVAADAIAGAMATAIGGAEDDDDTTRRVLAALRANRDGLELILAADDVVDAEVLDPVGDAIRAVLEPYVGATWTADAAEAASIALVSALEEHADDVAAYLGLVRLDGGELNGERLAALARAIATATDRYNGEGTAVLAALARDGWRLERAGRPGRVTP